MTSEVIYRVYFVPKCQMYAVPPDRFAASEATATKIIRENKSNFYWGFYKPEVLEE